MYLNVHLNENPIHKFQLVSHTTTNVAFSLGNQIFEILYPFQQIQPVAILFTRFEYSVIQWQRFHVCELSFHQPHLQRFTKIQNVRYFMINCAYYF